MTLPLLDWRRRVAALYAEVRGEPDPVVAHQWWRQGRDDLLATHSESPLLPDARATFTGLAVAPYDPRVRFETAVEAVAAPARFEAVTGTDGVVSFERIGRVRLGLLGALDVWWLSSYGGGLFVPLRDRTAGTSTYGGGRYLIDTAKGADLGGGLDHLVVDLNFAYNPSCAYDPAWACPLAPAGNVLQGSVLAGELAGG